MSNLPLPQPAAKTWSRVAMATAALAFVGAAAMFVLPRQRIEVQTAGPTEFGNLPPREPPKNPAEGVRTDWTSLGPSLQDLNSPELARFRQLLEDRRAAQAAKTDNEADPEVAAKSGGFAPPWRFIGTISDDGRLSALVEIDLKQRFLRAGYKSPDGYELVSVTPDQLIVAQGRTRHTIRREKSSMGESLTTGSAFSAPRMTPDFSDNLDAVDAMEARRRRAGGGQ